MSQKSGDSPDAPTWTISSGEDLGRAIAEIRRRQGLTQEAFAAEVGLQRAYLAQIESGRSVRLLEHLLRVLRRAGATVTITLNSDDGEA
jgi:transcriptional regulator with XRE-family HTH domain